MHSPNRRHERETFFKYTTAETALAIITSGRLRRSSPVLFNDPFDVPREVAFGFTARDLRQEMATDFGRLVASTEDPADPAVRNLVGMLRRHDTPALTAVVAATLGEPTGRFASILDDGLEEFAKAWQEVVPDLRILCVSSIRDSTPMWAHYAGGGTGAVLEFAASDELDSSLLLAQPVVYQAEPPLLPETSTWARAITRKADINWHEFFKNYYYVKSPEWSYEQEWRVVSFSPEAEREHYSDWPFHPRELVAVYLGALATEPTATALSQALVDDLAHVSLYRTILQHNDRRLSFTRLR